MEWKNYKRRFQTAAKKQSLSDIEKSALLDYARVLHDQGLPIIFDIPHLAGELKMSTRELIALSRNAAGKYKRFSILKRNGTKREIMEPYEDLKTVQRWILDNILNHLPVSRFAKAYIPRKNIKENARFHLKNSVVMTVDIRDFFGSIAAKSILQIFQNAGFHIDVAIALAKLCTEGNRLPQGAPTSPALSNIYFYEADKRVSQYAMQHGLRYTRYADDLTFSGDIHSHALMGFLVGLLFEYGFVLNPKKTRIMRDGSQKEVTGIIVNEKMQVPRAYRFKIRQECHYICKFGLNDHVYHIEEFRRNYVRNLIGRIHHCLNINPQDTQRSLYEKTLNQYLLPEIQSDIK